MFFKRCFHFVCVCLCLPPLIQLLEVGFSNLWLLSSWRHTLTSLTSPELSPESSATIRRKCCSRKSGTGWDSNHVAPDFRPCPSYLSVPLPKRFQFVKMCCSFFFFLKVWARPANQWQSVCDGCWSLKLQRREAAEESPAGTPRQHHLCEHCRQITNYFDLIFPLRACWHNTFNRSNTEFFSIKILYLPGESKTI